MLFVNELGLGITLFYEHLEYCAGLWKVEIILHEFDIS